MTDTLALVTVGESAVTIEATHEELYAWANRPGMAWPCSGLARLEGPLVVTFDSNGLLDLEGDGGPDSDLSGDELSAWAADMLAPVLDPEHPAFAVAVSQHLGGCQWFALCDRQAVTTCPHPVLGRVACCAMCAGFAGGKS